MLRAAVIIPALNEEESLGATLDRVPRNLFQTVIVADNGSTDRTAEVAREHGAIVVNELERGYGAACLAALAAVPTDTEAVAFMQADSSEDPEEAALLLAPIADGRADLVLGSRMMGRAERGSVRIHQAFGNRLATFLIRILFGYRYTDLGPFRAIRLESLRALGMRDRNYGWTVEMQIKALRHGLRVLEVPVSYKRRLAGEEKVAGNPIASVKAGTKILWTVAKLKAW